MKKILFILCLMFACPCRSMEIKKVAMIGKEIVSNRDFANYKVLISILDPMASKHSEKEMLDNLIELRLYAQYADLIGMKPSLDRRNAIIAEIRRSGANLFVSSSEMLKLLDDYMLAGDVLQNVVIPAIQLSEQDIITAKTTLQRNKDSINLVKIKDDGSQQKIGWVALSDLNPKLVELVKKTRVGQLTEEFEGSKFLVSDKENSKILSIRYYGDNSEVAFLSDLSSQKRKKLLSEAVSASADQSDKVVQLIKSQLAEIAFSYSFDSQRKEFIEHLKSNTYIVKY